VSSGSIDLRATIDRRWLDRVAAADPIAHAYALWDLDRFPEQVRFVSAVRGETTVGYLLIWLGRRTVPVVHWFGVSADARALAEGLPPRPLVAIIPEEVRPDVERLRGPAEARPLRLLVAGPAPAPSPPEATSAVRALTGTDRASLAAWASGRSEMVVTDYPYLDPDREAIWGCFEHGRLCGVARAVVRLPTVWILGGVYVEPEARGRGLGLELVRAVLAAGRRAGAVVALYVREDRPAARAVYDRAGFEPRGRRLWVDAGAGLEP
jgi:ribosomal protein S18 acetylase RimI-like enzyme